MPDNWADIFAHRLPTTLPAAPAVAPVSHRPTCPADCSGRHAPDGFLICRKCGGVKYAVIAHEYCGREGHNFNTLEPMNGAPAHDGREQTCCGVPLVRGWR